MSDCKGVEYDPHSVEACFTEVNRNRHDSIRVLWEQYQSGTLPPSDATSRASTLELILGERVTVKYKRDAVSGSINSIAIRDSASPDCKGENFMAILQDQGCVAFRGETGHLDAFLDFAYGVFDNDRIEGAFKSPCDVRVPLGGLGPGLNYDEFAKRVEIVEYAIWIKRTEVCGETDDKMTIISVLKDGTELIVPTDEDAPGEPIGIEYDPGHSFQPGDYSPITEPPTPSIPSLASISPREPSLSEQCQLSGSPGNGITTKSPEADNQSVSPMQLDFPEDNGPQPVLGEHQEINAPVGEAGLIPGLEHTCEPEEAILEPSSPKDLAVPDSHPAETVRYETPDNDMSLVPTGTPPKSYNLQDQMEEDAKLAVAMSTETPSRYSLRTRYERVAPPVMQQSPSKKSPSKEATEVAGEKKTPRKKKGTAQRVRRR